jgi:hypothetical protein
VYRHPPGQTWDFNQEAKQPKQASMRSLTAITPLLLASTHAHAHVPALPQLSISKRDRHTGGATNHFARSIPLDLLQKRQDTVGSNIFNVLSWSTGGAYYANRNLLSPSRAIDSSS